MAKTRRSKSAQLSQTFEKMESRSPFRIPRNYPTLAQLSRSPQGSGCKDGHPRRSSRVETLTDTCEGFGITNAAIFARVLDFWSWTPTLKVGNNLQGSQEKLFFVTCCLLRTLFNSEAGRDDSMSEEGFGSVALTSRGT